MSCAKCGGFLSGVAARFGVHAACKRSDIERHRGAAVVAIRSPSDVLLFPSQLLIFAATIFVYGLIAAGISR